MLDTSPPGREENDEKVDTDEEDDNDKDTNGDAGDDDNKKGPKTTKGEDCQSSFKYKGKTYNACTHVDHAGPW